MAQYITRRLLNMLITLAFISIISFAIIQLPPGDYLTSYIAQLRAAGEEVNEELIESLRMQYGLGKTPVQQYFKWVWNFVQGNMGQSFIYDRPVNDLIWERLGLTFMIATTSLVFTWLLALPIGIYSAVRQYSFGDYLFTFLSFIGLAVPNFMLALALMFTGFKWLGLDVGGLFSVEYESAPWSIAKFVDLLEHLWVPTVVLGTAGTAALVRIMRANLLDELRKLYVITARAKGVAEGRLIIKYPVRIALNPFISSVGWILPTLISGATITAIVLNLPTTGPMLVDALMQQDMFLAGSFIMMLSTLTVIGMLISDVMLVLADPRIRIGTANE